MKVCFRERCFDVALMAALLVVTATMEQAQVGTPATLEMPQSHNPLSPYMGENVAEPVLTNSPRLDRLVRDGKLHLSLKDAIDLALENNLDLAIARYNLPIADTDLLRTKAGGSFRGVNTGVVQGTPGGGIGGYGAGAPGAGAGGTTGGAGGAGASGLVQSTLGVGTPVASYDPALNVSAGIEHLALPLSSTQVYGVPSLQLNTTQVNASYTQAFSTGTSLSFEFNLANRQISRQAARNALLPTLSLVGFYGGSGLAGLVTPGNTSSVPTDLAGSWQNAFNNSSPDYFVGLNLNIPFRNRVAKADQYRSELEYRQASLRKEQLRKQIRIEVRNAQYALEQSRARVESARKARDLAERTFEITKKEQELGAGSSYQTMTAQRDLSVAELDLVTAMTTYRKERVELDRATGATLEHNGVLIQDAVTGTVTRSLESSHLHQNRAPRILAADDQPHILEALHLLLHPPGLSGGERQISRRGQGGIGGGFL